MSGKYTFFAPRQTKKRRAAFPAGDYPVNARR
jgi:hypothetical protein